MEDNDYGILAPERLGSAGDVAKLLTNPGRVLGPNLPVGVSERELMFQPGSSIEIG